MILRRPVVATAVIIATLAAYWSVTQLVALQRLARLQPLDPRGAYRITLDFAPERFHQVRLQEAGRLVEVRGNTVFMKDVTPVALRGIAAEYWVHDVARWDGS